MSDSRPRRPRTLPSGAWAAVALALVTLAVVPSVGRPGDLPCHRDLLDFFLPMKAHLARSLAQGHVPWWDPFTLGGTPFFATLQSQVLYPPNWIHVLVPLPWSVSLFLAAHLAWAGEGARRAGLALGLTPAAALLSGVAWCAGGFVVSTTDLTNQLCTVAWMPWMAAAALAFARAPGARPLAAWAAASALALLGGEPQLALEAGAFSVALAALASPQRPSLTHARRVAVSALGVAALVAAATSVQVVPFAELVARSDRIGGESYAQGGRHALPPSGWVSFARAPRSSWMSESGPYVRSLHVGLPCVLLALAGVALGRRRGLVLGAVIAVSLALAAGPHLPLAGPALVDATPWLRYPVKHAALAALAIPLAAGLGLDRVLERLSSARARAALAATAVAATALLLAHAHRDFVLAVPHDALLRPSAVHRLLAADTHDGSRVHVTPLSAERLARRAEFVARGRLLEAQRERVELLEGALPSLFGVHSTTGAAALVPREQAALLKRAEGPLPEDLRRGLRAGFVLDESSRRLPLTRVPVDGGAASLYVLPGAGAPRAFEWDGPNRAVGAPGTPPPSSYPGWREGPPGTWTFRPRGLVPLGVASVLAWLLLAALALAPSRVSRTLGYHPRPTVAG